VESVITVPPQSGERPLPLTMKIEGLGDRWPRSGAQPYRL